MYMKKNRNSDEITPNEGQSRLFVYMTENKNKCTEVVDHFIVTKN